MSDHPTIAPTIYTRNTWQFWLAVAFLSPVAIWLRLKETVDGR
jgi:hypothetical protein